jgi:hypothetical protein
MGQVHNHIHFSERRFIHIIWFKFTPGVLTPTTFDQMQTASMLGGFSATIKATPPAASLYLTAGMGPYVGFFYAVEVSF